MNKTLEQVKLELAKEVFDAEFVTATRINKEMFIKGWDQCLSHLSNAGPEFDEKAALESANSCEAEDHWSVPSYIMGAHYQHTQTQALIAARDARIEKLEAALVRIRHHVVGFKASSEILIEIDEALGDQSGK